MSAQYMHDAFGRTVTYQIMHVYTMKMGGCS